jgi:hypothetical protein
VAGGKVEAAEAADVEEEEDGRVDDGRGGRARAVLGVSCSVATSRKKRKQRGFFSPTQVSSRWLMATAVVGKNSG